MPAYETGLTQSTDNELIDTLRETITNTTLERPTLDTALEAVIKHLPVYLKVVKSHISQLETVLNTDQHNYKSLENADLATVVKQLMAIFSELTDDDLVTLEQMASLAKTWETKTTSTDETTSKTEQQLP